MALIKPALAKFGGVNDLTLSRRAGLGGRRHHGQGNQQDGERHGDGVIRYSPGHEGFSFVAYPDKDDNMKRRRAQSAPSRRHRTKRYTSPSSGMDPISRRFSLPAGRIMSRVRCAANAVGRPAMASATVVSVSGAAAVSAAAVRAASASSTCASAGNSQGSASAVHCVRMPAFHSSRGRAARHVIRRRGKRYAIVSGGVLCLGRMGLAKGVETRRCDPGECGDRIIIDHPGRLVGDGGRGSRQAFTRKRSDHGDPIVLVLLLPHGDDGDIEQGVVIERDRYRGTKPAEFDDGVLEE